MPLAGRRRCLSLSHALARSLTSRHEPPPAAERRSAGLTRQSSSDARSFPSCQAWHRSYLSSRELNNILANAGACLAASLPSSYPAPAIPPHCLCVTHTRMRTVMARKRGSPPMFISSPCPNPLLMLMTLPPCHRPAGHRETVHGDARAVYPRHPINTANFAALQLRIASALSLSTSAGEDGRVTQVVSSDLNVPHLLLPLFSASRARSLSFFGAHCSGRAGALGP